MSTLTPFGKTIRKLRIEHGWKLLDVADKLGVTSSYLSAVETGKKPIPDGFLHKISRALDITTDELRELRRAVDKTRTEINVSKRDENQREFLAAFARQLDNVPQNIIDDLKKIVLKSVQGERPFRRVRRGFVVPAMSTHKLRNLALKVRSIFSPDDNPYFQIVDVIEIHLPKLESGFIFEVQDSSVMGEHEGRVPIGSNQIILREDVYERACRGKPRDRFTAAHEFAHYCMHRQISLARVREDEDKIYCDSEWQADTFAGTLLAPPGQAALWQDEHKLAAACGVSTHAARVMLAKYRGEGQI